MDRLPHSLLLQILSRLNDSADVARCRVASKAFNTVYPGLRSINLRCSSEWYSRVSNSERIKPFQRVFLDLISKLETVESVCIVLEKSFLTDVDSESDDLIDFYFTEGDFCKRWLPRVSGSLKSLSISDEVGESPSNVLPLISKYCRNLVNLKLKRVWLSMHDMNPMPMLTSLTLALIRLRDEHLNKLNKCCPNLQVLNLVDVTGLKDPKIHLLNLKTFLWDVYYNPPSLTLITPNLVTLKIKCTLPAALHIKAPMLSHFHLNLKSEVSLTVKKFKNLKTLWLDSLYIGSLLSKFPITTTVENLSLDSAYVAPSDATDSKLTLGKVFTVFPNVSSLHINSGPWSVLEACLNPRDWAILEGRKGLKTICAHLELVDLSLTFSAVACLLDQCVGLSEVSLLINIDADDTLSETFESKCMARWPGLKWRWGIWSEGMEDAWITDAISN